VRESVIRLCRCKGRSVEGVAGRPPASGLGPRSSLPTPEESTIETVILTNSPSRSNVAVSAVLTLSQCKEIFSVTRS